MRTHLQRLGDVVLAAVRVDAPSEAMRAGCEEAAAAVVTLRHHAPRLDLARSAFVACQQRLRREPRPLAMVMLHWDEVRDEVKADWREAVRRVLAESEIMDGLLNLKTEWLADGRGRERYAMAPNDETDDAPGADEALVQTLPNLRARWTEHITRVTESDLAEPGDVRQLLLAAGSQVGKWFGMELSSFAEFRKRVSVTLPPLPGAWAKPLIILSDDALDDDVDAVEAVTHEADHVRDLKEKYRDASIWPAEVNWLVLYAADDDARASCEAKPYFNGKYARAMVDGRPIDPAAIRASAHSIYLLGEGGLALVDAEVASHMDSVAANRGRPPTWMAREFAAWADDRYPSIIHRPWDTRR